MKSSQTSVNGVSASRLLESRLLESLCAQGDRVVLNAQQSLPLPLADKVIVLRDGMLAIDAMPAKGKLQVLDFLLAGDVVSSSKILSARKVSLRAITRSSAIVLQPLDLSPTALEPECWRFLVEQCFNQITRVNLHQLMTGRLETEARVASFILALALREGSLDDRREVLVALPMSRVDIANYLVINCDTLSRTMMKFSDGGVVERVSRHAIRVKDLPALQKKSPIAGLLAEVVGRMHAPRADLCLPEARAETALRGADCDRTGAHGLAARAPLSAAE
ncbi:CRP-like cAMP-binding protein [Roseiarcus fermentans]|uniref:CRP-like cAMP-binding protein n=1 Tax=Roseiarcus fermentans TaxID=1473586 RepID=A0A366EXM7_9HYPH|nr:Crp/Fnr family transcriptional regulator [Roseiarcus fermentans]RBP07138.1 CRP-like cAMP-binding protein [Roseiarcus fermentans]